MKKNYFKTVFIAFLALITLPAIGQHKESKWDFRIGAGYSILGSGDYHTFNYENELNYRMNPYFTASASFDMGKSITGISGTASFKQGNLNIFLSPFKNTKKNDFRVGTGLTFYTITDAYEIASYYENGVLVCTDYSFDSRNSYGYNIIFENSYWLTEKMMLGVKLYTQYYFNDDINTGILLKLGFKW
ncbi:MAG: hypothetical protein JXR71_05350 [Bacteroidales bacterium]|nr:hypothetical protein [Bacteroidales bacterium]